MTSRTPAGGRAFPASPVAPPVPPPTSPSASQDGASPIPENGRGDGRPVAAPPLPATAAGARRRRITVEGALWLLVVGLAALTRLWDLGSRTLHHDESLHAYYSWLLATGQGYVHDPLMHGPFLFHFNALIYALFGATDATSRATAAIAGVVLVALPALLRSPRLLGRWGALAAGVLLLVSPAILYQSRYIRHDVFTAAGALLLFVAVVRYVERPERRWLVVGGATLGFLITNHEIVFAIAALFAAALAGALLWGRLRPILPVVAAAGVAGLALLKIVPGATGRPLPPIPWQNPTRDQQFAYYRELLTNPLTISVVLLLVIAVAACCLVLLRRYGPERPPEGWVERILGGGAAGSVQEAVRSAWADRTGLSLALAVGVAIFVVLFTTLFTNLYGLATGTIATDGTLLYWLGQHDVRRGEQPWFYYLLLFPQYEFVAVLLGGAATVGVAIEAVRVGLGRAPAGPRFFARAVLAIWFVGIFAALSWAGEKMPWLVVHISLPATLLAASLLGGLAERWRPAIGAAGTRVRGWGWPEWGTVAALLALGAGWILLANRLTFGEFTPSTADLKGGWDRTLPAWALRWWWTLAVPPAIGLALLALGALRRGTRRTGQAAMAALVAGLVLLQIHAAWRMTYLEGDVPKDMLIYTQTSPDVGRMVRELTALSQEMTGGNGLEIWYDDNDGLSWPMQWYLRDFPNRRMFGHTLFGPPEGSPPVLMTSDSNDRSVRPFMDGYTRQEYVFRWWFPEDPIYRPFAVAPELNVGRSAWTDPNAPHDLPAIARSVLSSLSALLHPEEQERVFLLAMDRDLPVGIDSKKYYLYVRNDLLPLFNTIRY